MRSSARTRRQSTPITLDNEPPPPCLAFARPLRRQRATVGRRWRRVSTTSTPARADWHRSLPSRRAAVTEHRSTLDERGRRRSYRRIRSNERRTRRYLAKECRRVTDSATRKTTTGSDVVSCDARAASAASSRECEQRLSAGRGGAHASTLPLARNDVDDARRTTSTQSATRRRPSRTVAVEAAPVAGGGRRRASFAHSDASARCDRRARTTLSSSASSSLDTSVLRLRTTI